MIELVCFIVIAGILLGASLHYLNANNKQLCISKLKQELNLTRQKIAQIYTKDFLDSKITNNNVIFSILDSLNGFNAKCYFSLQQNRLIAHIYDENLAFNISDFTNSAPNIVCNLQDRFCKEFNDKVLDK